jgi:heme A synthase
VEREALARLGLGLELGLVASEAVLAVWFYKLFRRFNPGAAWAVAAFGIVTAVAIMVSAQFMAGALTVAGDASLAPGGDVAATTQLMFELSSHAWGVGSLFFGLWLIPMATPSSRRSSCPSGWAGPSSPEAAPIS